MAIIPFGTWTKLNFHYVPNSKQLTTCAKSILAKPNVQSQKTFYDFITFLINQRPDITVGELADALAIVPDFQDLAQAVRDLENVSTVTVSRILANERVAISRENDICLNTILTAFASGMHIFPADKSFIAFVEACAATYPTMTVVQLAQNMIKSKEYGLRPLGLKLVDIALKVGPARVYKSMTVFGHELSMHDRSLFSFATPESVAHATNLADLADLIEKTDPHIIVVVSPHKDLSLANEVVSAKTLLTRLYMTCTSRLIILSLDNSVEVASFIRWDANTVISFGEHLALRDRTTYINALYAVMSEGVSFVEAHSQAASQISRPYLVHIHDPASKQ